MVEQSRLETPAEPETGRTWSVDASSLDVLKDLGLSDTQIARYLGVSSEVVSSLLETPRETA